MKNKIAQLCIAFLSISIISNAQVSKQCGTMEYLEMLKSKDSGIEARMKSIEDQTRQWISTNSHLKSMAVKTIPVVVHVVYYNSTQNISDAQIQSQIAVLNQDFRRLNADASNTPSAFSSVAADVQIEFCLAFRDPNGNTTTGITRTQTSSTSFNYLYDYMK